ncbi:prepilin-type N-terminal cleavage/methylation domain-containing protein [Cerasicoccus arenae]|nr:prepilin-type N-terminal cleavage/methylation domain-containing protein [Cerasicoccus arenae]
MFCVRRQVSGFTLVELLTVIAIIGILAAILGGVVSGVREQQEKVVCAQNMRQLGTAILLHANEHQGRFPLTMHNVSDEEESWVYTLSPYLEDVDAVRVCPADPQAEERLEQGLSSYALNEFVFVPALDQLGRPLGGSYDSVFKLDDPARTQLAYIISDQKPLSAYSDHTHSRGWKNWSRVVADIQPNRFSRGESAANGLGGSANYLFADGHVELVDADDFKSQFSGGRNPADPTQTYR